jgi:hypothetical protein
MLRILGSPRRLCNGVTRREWLIASAAAATGVSSSHLQAEANRGGGSAKNVILLYLFGGPSHLDMLDMKPDAPAEVRGDFRPIRSSLPGCDVCEELPHLAQVMDRATVVRSLNHPWNFHGMMWATTGITEGSVPIEESQRNAAHWPYVGSVFDYFEKQKHGPKAAGAVPDNIMLPWPISSRRAQIPYARAHGAFLGNSYDPLWTEFVGEATRTAPRWHTAPREDVPDPHLGITAKGHFQLAPEARLSDDITLDRLNQRRSLLEQFDSARRRFDTGAAGRQYDHRRTLAHSLLNSPKLPVAFDLDREPRRLRESYGMTLFGQGCLQARRLVEAGCRFVTVIWDEFGQLNTGWDTHIDHRNRMKDELLPGLDRAFSTLVLDLEARGMLDETLVCVMNEMGRTPKLEGDGRGHWGRAYTNFFAGGGIKRGNVIGKTDKLGASVTERPISAKDVLATIYHLVGLDPETTVIDRQNKPLPLVHGDVVPEMLA